MILSVLCNYKLSKIFLLLSCVFLTPEKGFNQIISNRQNANENIYLARTKQFNEFLDRFNYKTDFKGNPIDSSFSAKMPRQRWLNSLFDMKDKRLLTGDQYSADYVNLTTRFINEITSNNLLINKFSGNILAEAKSRILYNDTPHTISLFLNQEVTGNNMVKWVIVDVKGEILNFLRKDTSFNRFLPPISNETDFMSLKKALDDVNHLNYYASESFEINTLSIFFYCLNTGLIKFDYVQEIRYHVLDIPGWCIKVKDFNRLEMNSGWLIYDLTTNTLGTKDYLKTLQ